MSRTCGEQAPGDGAVSEHPSPDRVLDTVGFLCPIPVIKTGRALATMKQDEVLELIADDRGVLFDVPDWCVGHGHEYLGHRQDGRVYHLFVRKRL